MAEIQDYTKAFDILKEYPSSDGLHVDTLLDSDKHGALTYNDFLILPGSISKEPHIITIPHVSNNLTSFPSIGRYFRYQGHQAIHPQGPPPLFPHGHCD